MSTNPEEPNRAPVTFNVGHNGTEIAMTFDRDIAFMTFTPAQARTLGRYLLTVADEIDPQGAVAHTAPH